MYLNKTLPNNLAHNVHCCLVTVTGPDLQIYFLTVHITRQTYIYEIAEKSPQQILEDNMNTSAVITLMRAAHKVSDHHLHHE